jgi:cell division protein FtsQ
MPERKLLIFMVILIIVLALISFFLSPFFKLRDIDIAGLNNMSTSNINDMVSSYIKTNIWLIDKQEIKDKISLSNYVESANIKKRYPNSLLIDINERIPLGKINNNGIFLVFDKDGYILEKGALHKKNVPEFIGVGYSFQGNKILFASTFLKIVQALNVIDEEIKKQINKIEYDGNKEKINMILKSQIQVALGSDIEITKKFKVLQSALKKIENEKLEVSYINLSIISKPVIKTKNN